jgi:hypothetical protein
MKSRSLRLALGLVLAFTGLACGDGDGPPGEDIGSDEQSLIYANGISVNGISVNGISVNGISVNGISVNGVAITGVTLSATKFTGKNSSGQTITGAQFVGSKFVATKADGTTINLRVDSATVGTGANTDVWMYDMSMEVSAGRWSPMCGLEANGVTPILAVPVNGVWDYRSGVTGGGAWTASSTTFTFACRNAAAAKCVEMGYKPWKTLPTGTGSLLNHHLSCVRLIRADYCGDGKSWTENGKLVNIYDKYGLQTDAASWPAEAEWTQNGARCITPTTDTRARQRVAQIPSCFPTKFSITCGSTANFTSAGTLLITEVQ